MERLLEHGFYGLAESHTKSLPEMLHEPFVCLNWTEFTGQRGGENLFVGRGEMVQV